jgi:hypothetical protein
LGLAYLSFPLASTPSSLKKGIERWGLGDREKIYESKYCCKRLEKSFD